MANSCSKASQEALWLQMGCITFWKVSLALSHSALFPAQLSQISEPCDNAQKAAAGCLQEATHPTAPAPSYHKFTGEARSPRDAGAQGPILRVQGFEGLFLAPQSPNPASFPYFCPCPVPAALGGGHLLLHCLRGHTGPELLNTKALIP